METLSFLAEESAILSYAAMLGLEIGLVYDLFRIFRRVWNCHILASVIMDMSFWCFVAYRTFFIMHTYSNGELRWFAVFSAIVVLGLYMNILSRFIVWVGVITLSTWKNGCMRIKKALTGIWKMTIIKLRRKKKREGKKRGKKSCISDKIS